MLIKRASGCLYGQLIGDSLGCRYEFKSAGEVRQMIREDYSCTQQDQPFVPILGGGPFQLQPGQVTDDSEMALSLASSLIRCGTFSASDVACSYAYWFQSGPPDFGRATQNALTIRRKLTPYWYQELSDDEKESVHQEISNNVKKYNIGSLSNGCLMRISPLALFSHNATMQKVKEMIQADCALTHCEEDCKEAVFSYVMAIRDMINGKSNKEAYETALSVTQSTRIREHLLTAQERPVPVNIGTEIVDGDKKAMGYIGVALQSAFYELLNGTSFSKSLIDAVSRGGDTDTNAAIVGALLGSYYGVDGIPEQWISTVNNSRPRKSFDCVDYNVERVVSKLVK